MFSTPVKVDVPPLTSLCAGNIPSVFDNTMSYYDELTSLIAYLENTIIPAINGNAEIVNQLIQYIENIDFKKYSEESIYELIKDGKVEVTLDYDPANEALTLNLGGTNNE